MKSLKRALAAGAIVLFGTPALAACDLTSTFENFDLLDDAQQAQVIVDCTADGTDWTQSFSLYFQTSTPLYYAARNGLAGAFYALLQAGADPNLRNTDGETPLFAFAARAGHRSAPLAVPGIAALLAAGADPKIRSEIGATALHMATLLSTPQVVRAVLNSGIAPDYPHQNGQPALTWMDVDNCDPQIGLVLIEYGAKLRGVAPRFHDGFLSQLDTGCDQHPDYPTLRAALLDIMDRS